MTTHTYYPTAIKIIYKSTSGCMSEDVISATGECSERVADNISEQMYKNHIQIHPLL